MQGALVELAASLPAPHVIYDRAGFSPYLSRYYLKNGPTMPDGSHPFAADGTPKEGILDPDRPYAVFLHRFHRGDDEPELHSHPWEWGVSLILSGGYLEERRRGAPERGGSVIVRTVRPGHVNVLRAHDYHRVTLLGASGTETWSLFLAGPRTGADWGFWNRSTGRLLPWREFIREKRISPFGGA